MAHVVCVVKTPEQTANYVRPSPVKKKKVHIWILLPWSNLIMSSDFANASVDVDVSVS